MIKVNVLVKSLDAYGVLKFNLKFNEFLINEFNIYTTRTGFLIIESSQ